MKIFKRIASGTSAAVLTLSTIMTMGFTGVAHATSGSDTCTWTGATDTKFSTATNWSGCSGAAPVSGDSLVFDATSLTNGQSLTDDIASLSVFSITFKGANANQSSYSITGTDPLTITNSVILQGNLGGDIGSDVTLGSSITITSDSSAFMSFSKVNLNGHNITVGDGTNQARVGVTGALSGNGNLSVLAKSSMTLYTAPSVTWQGTVTIASGGAFYTDGSDANALGDPGNTVTVASGGLLGFENANGVTIPQSITVGGTGASDNPGAISSYAGYQSSGDLTLSGTITLTANTTVTSYGKLTVSGPLHGSFTLTPRVGMQGSLVINSSDNQSQTKNGTFTAPATTNNDTDNQPNQFVDVGNNVTEVVDGQRGYVSVENGGVLKGTGQVSDISVAKGGIVAPGHSPGKLTVLNTLSVVNGATYQAELKDTAIGDYDQIAVGKPADTTGNDVTLGDGTPADGYPTLDVQLYTGYNLKAGDQFRIIDNLSGTAVLGQFNNLPEGATFNGPNGSVFKITYKGGDGNDVVLTVMTAPKAPDTGFALMAAHPGATLGLTVLAAGTIFAIARSNRKPAPARARASRSKRR